MISSALIFTPAAFDPWRAFSKLFTTSASKQVSASVSAQTTCILALFQKSSSNLP